MLHHIIRPVRSARTHLNASVVLVAAALSAGCATDSMVTLTYRVVGQCDTMFGSTDANGNPIADVPGTAYLVIDVFKIENNRSQAVEFNLIDKDLFLNVGGVQSFDIDHIAHAPSPFVVPAGVVQNNISLPYVATVPGMANQDHPSRDSAAVDWHAQYNAHNLPDGQGVLLIKLPPGPGGQVEADCFGLRIGP